MNNYFVRYEYRTRASDIPKVESTIVQMEDETELTVDNFKEAVMNKTWHKPTDILTINKL